MKTNEALDKVQGDGGDRPLKSERLTMLQDEVDALAKQLDQGTWSRRDDAQKARFCQWTGQSPDGRKHRDYANGKEPTPFEGACDSRIRTADMLVNERAAILTTAAMRASYQPAAGMEATDQAMAMQINTLLKWIIRNQLGRAYRREIKKLAQWQEGDTPAVAILGVFWHQESGLENKPVSIEDLAEAVLSAAGPAAGELAQDTLDGLQALMLDPEREEEAIAFLQGLLPMIATARAKTMLRAWRNGEEASFPMPYTKVGSPKIAALRLMEDVFIPANTGDLARARVIIHREWLSRAELEERRISMGYSKAFVDKVLELGENETGLDGLTAFPVTQSETRDDGGQLITTETVKDLHKNEYEILTAYYKATNEDSVMGIYTVPFHQKVDIPAKREELLDYAHGEYPFVEFAREYLTARLLDSRSVPELEMQAQTLQKLLHDTRGNHAQVSALPPVYTPANRPNVPLLIGPLKQIKRKRTTDYEWMKPPAYPQTTDVQVREIEKLRDQYFGRYGENVPPELVVVLVQDMVDQFLGSLADAHAMLVQLAQQYIPDEQIARITGIRNMPIVRGREEIQGKYDLELTFDARTLNPEWVTRLVESIQTYVLAMDREQTVQRDRLVQWVMYAINPQLAEFTLQPVDTANRKEVDDEELNIVKIRSGIEPEMAEEGQNFGLRLQVLEDRLNGNPEIYEQAGELGQQMFQRRVEHLRFQVQQQENAQTGRVGAQPVLAGE